MKTDGGCPANPGPGAWAFVIEGHGDNQIERAGFLPHATNNQAEYRAITAAALVLARLGGETPLPDHIEFWSDSQLIVRQLNREYRVLDPILLPFYTEAQDAMHTLRTLMPKASIKIDWFRREHNTRADELCNAVLRKNGVVLKSK